MGRKKKVESKSARPSYDRDQVASHCRWQWGSVISALTGIDRSLLNSKHHPCPKPGCSSDTDAFRAFDDFEETGGIICNQCARNCANGFDTIIWWTGKKFYDVVVMVAEHLGIPSSNNHADFKSNGKHNADPAEHLTFREWDDGYDLLVQYWCETKKPVTLEAVKICGAKIARYQYYDNHYAVIALPVWGEQLTASDPIGWSLYNLTGGPLPGPKQTWVKVKLTYGSTKPGLIGPVERLAAAREVWKLEGPSDLLAFWSLAGIPSDVVAITNKAGCGERPTEWMLKLLAGKRVNILHDADEPGQRGANGYTDERGRWHPGWLESLAAESEPWSVVLPFEVKPDHGQDLRDFLNEVKNASANENSVL